MCEARMDVLRVVAGRVGFEHRTLRCTKCSLICEAQALERLAGQRHAELASAAGRPYPPAAERILANLLSRTSSRAP